MKSIRTAIVFGFLIWLIPFLVSILIFPVRISERPLFESIMPVVLTATTVAFAVLYFRKVEKAFLAEGAAIGVVWFVMSIAIDLPLFMGGPMRMDPMDYVKDIGVTYLLIPTITLGFGYLKKVNSSD